MNLSQNWQNHLPASVSSYFVQVSSTWHWGAQWSIVAKVGSEKISLCHSPNAEKPIKHLGKSGLLLSLGILEPFWLYVLFLWGEFSCLVSDITQILFHCWFQLLLWHRKRITETCGRDCPPNSGAPDHEKRVIGSGKVLICCCTIHHILSIWSFIFHCCTVYWWFSNLKLLTLVLWDVFIYGANLPCILLLWVWAVAAWCSKWDWKKVRKVGSSTKMLTKITDLNLVILPKYAERLQ